MKPKTWSLIVNPDEEGLFTAQMEREGFTSRSAFIRSRLGLPELGPVGIHKGKHKSAGQPRERAWHFGRNAKGAVRECDANGWTNRERLSDVRRVRAYSRREARRMYESGDCHRSE